MTVCPNMPLALNTSLHNDLLLATEVLYTMLAKCCIGVCLPSLVWCVHLGQTLLNLFSVNKW